MTAALPQQRSAPQRPREIYIEEIYGLELINIPAAGSLSGSFTILQNTRFELRQRCYLADKTIAAQTDSSRVVPNVKVLITSTGSQQQFMNIASQVDALFGRGDLPYVLTSPQRFDGGTTISVQATNREAVQVSLFLYFIGVNVYQAV